MNQKRLYGIDENFLQTESFYLNFNKSNFRLKIGLACRGKENHFKALKL